MKKLPLLALFFSLSAFTNDCPEGNISFVKVMTVQYAETIQDCKNISTTCEFIGTDSAGYRIPNKLKNKVVFRCKAEGLDAGKSLTGEPLGNFCFVEAKGPEAELLYTLKSGDKISLTGEVFVNNNMGYKQVNFICSSIKK